jgi:DNA (cytosine-5)-methyltransferase 1
MRFIDLFAGLGGFHVALEELGHECVFASEINKDLRPLYEVNHGIKAAGDIRLVNEWEIPAHDILCAGFPCQAFSKAGAQDGVNDEIRGTLFAEIVRVLAYHEPKYIILENVANLARHDQGRTWARIEDALTNVLHYKVRKMVLSPHQFGIPQIRQRVFIVGSREGLEDFQWPQPFVDHPTTLHDIVDSEPEVPGKAIPPRELACLHIWQRFLDALPDDCRLPGPLWSTEFGATYPFEDCTPWALPEGELANHTGCFGRPIVGATKEEQLKELPTYARFETQEFPVWKQAFIRQNREFYLQYKEYIDPILPEIQALPFSWQKFEWNCLGEERDIFKYAIQFRPSGVRVKRTNYSPALVSFSPTQTPIWGWLGRYMTPHEGAILQSMPNIKLPRNLVGVEPAAESEHREATERIIDAGTPQEQSVAVAA